MKKLIMIVLAAVTTGSAYAAPQQQQRPKPDTAKTKKVKYRDTKSNIRISGDTTGTKL